MKQNAAQPHFVDVAVGQRIRHHRKRLGISQSQLSGSIGVSFQQLQKYEKAENRGSASRLHEIATALTVTIAELFGEVPNTSRGL